MNELAAAERQRIEAECDRRAREIDPATYAPWQQWWVLMNQERLRLAAQMLRRAGAFPGPGDACLEIGCGSLGWMAHLINWGVRETDLHGVDIVEGALQRARAKLPSADLRLCDATDLPWDSCSFQIVIASTVFTSILCDDVRKLVADEITRVLAPGGALIWYDFAFNNPANSNVRKVSREELRQLFPKLRGEVRTLTLAPPLARLIAPRSWTLAVVLSAVPWLRTHLLAVLLKSQQPHDTD